jgi:hypothetical protein
LTPLKAIEAIQAVRFVPSTRYPVNTVCAHPECDRDDITRHHIFGRGTGEYSDSWFVLLPVNGHPGTEHHPSYMAKKAIPHVVGLCGHGTEGHHGDVEAHRAWIKHEDGVFVWYDRKDPDFDNPPRDNVDAPGHVWELVGPLDPQPFAWGDKKKKPVRRLEGAERRKRRTISIRVPADAQEDGGEIWDDLMGDGKKDRPYGRVREKLNLLMPAEGGERPAGDRDHYYVIVDALEDWLTS